MKEHYKHLLKMLMRRQVALINNQLIYLTQSKLFHLAHDELIKEGDVSYSTNAILEITKNADKIGIDFMTNHHCSSFLLSYSMFESTLYELFYEHYLHCDYLKNDSTYTASASSIFGQDIEFHQKAWAEANARSIIQMDNNKIFRKINSFFGFKLDKIEKYKNQFSEIRARRNVALHRSWIADHSYCSNYPSSGFQVGHPTYADFDYLLHANDVIDTIFQWLVDEFESKLKLT